jgi:hypothetical protein
MAIKHAFTSTKADGGDATLVRPSNWNADHTGESLGVVPVGGIILWSGTIASIPTNWALCNGAGGTPDLRDKFVVGAKQDDAGVAKTNLEGALSVTGGTTAHIHSTHAGLTHAGLTIGDHTGLTHSLQVANHPDLTHIAAGNHAATTLSHVSGTHSHAGSTIPDHSLASFTGLCPSITGSDASFTQSHSAHVTLSLSLSSTGTARTIVTGSTAHPAHSIGSVTHTHASVTHTHAAITLTHGSIASHTASHAATPDHSVAALTHAAAGTHSGTTYGVHTITQPADHGAAGTIVHSYSQPNAHTISAHDTVGNVIPYYALAYIMRVA